MDVLRPLYREGGLLFLLEYLSFAADKIRRRRRRAILIIIQILFISILDLSLLESGRSDDICVS